MLHCEWLILSYFTCGLFTKVQSLLNHTLCLKSLEKSWKKIFNLRDWRAQLLTHLMPLVSLPISCFGGIIDWWKTLIFISSWSYCQRHSLSQPSLLKTPEFHLISRCRNLWKRKDFAEFPQKFHTRKLD